MRPSLDKGGSALGLLFSKQELTDSNEHRRILFDVTITAAVV